MRDLLAECVHCGFCLPTCPTYVLWGQEPDSPRGRINLMEQDVLTESAVLHFDRCLGCMACVTACPSGVRYDVLIERTRAKVETGFKRKWRERALREAIFALFPYPRRLSVLRAPMRLYKALRLPMSGLLPTMRREKLDTVVPAKGKKRAVVGMLTGCVQSVFFQPVNAATARVLAAEGCEVRIPRGQGCCGALSVHNGRPWDQAPLARLFADVDFLVVNAAGCGSALKEGPLAAKTRDLSEMLVELGPVAPRHPLPLTVAYHDACHLAHAQRIRSQPRQLLHAIPELNVSELSEPDICCGSAGIWNVLHPGPGRQLGERKARDALATGAELLVTANPGCMMQINRFVKGGMRMAHTAQVLDASIRGLPREALVGRSAPASRG